MRKRNVPLFIALAMTVSAAAGCSSGKGTDSAGSTASAKPAVEDKYDKLPKEITIQYYESTPLPSEEGTWADNRWTKWINENSPVKVKWVPIPQAGGQAVRTQKINTMLAAGEAPDLIWDWGREYPASLIKQGAIQPVDEFVEKYSTAYKNYLAKYPGLKAGVTYDDGKMYNFTVNRQYNPALDTGVYIRQDWLNKLNLKMPTTLDDLIAVGKAFVEQDPDGNGKKDTVAFAFDGTRQFTYIEHMFQAGQGYWYVEDGKPKYGPTLDRYKDSLETFKKMYDLGLVDKEFPTDKNFDRETQLLTSGKAGMAIGHWTWGKLLDLKKTVPTAEMVPLPMVSNKYGKNGYARTPLDSTDIMVMLNKQAKNPKAAMEFIDWMLVKGWETMMFGIEGVHYKKENGVRVAIDQQKNAKEVYGSGYAIVKDYQTSVEELAKPKNPDPVVQAFNEMLVGGNKVFMKEEFRNDFPIGPLDDDKDKTVAAFNTELAQIRLKAIISGDKYTPSMAMEDIKKKWAEAGGEKAEKVMADFLAKQKK
ncbi:MAG: extracellular solute-binding protein [Paenibacillaceae bacterium]|nr:extracellular solute-binding protein [Paenibacillaceae bacterium]